MADHTFISGDVLNYRRYGTSSKNIIIFLHGVFGRGEDWIENGYLELLKKLGEISLIFVDLRGHGQSIKSYNQNAYDPKKNAEDLVKLMDTLEISKAIIWGYSYGGRMAFAMGVYHHNRVNQLIVGGMHPFPVFNVLESVEFRQSIIAKSMQAWIEYLDDQNIKISPYTRETLLLNDNQALVAIDQCIIDWTGFEQLKTLNHINTIIYFGERDRSYREMALEWSNNHPHCETIEFEGKNHFTTFSDSSDIISEIAPRLRLR